ncbi:Hsp70 family protein [Marinagarivorans algicola]|uniref:Hsp70 family protein n=1 Tax=Marinagarivorans algicola TaxID=1513270 RepID=UPI0006B5ADDA|nr:Hsp70 family protein [Marinagarivorans algicola]
MSEHNQTRYSVGIDLGTTHCVLSYVSLDEANASPKVLPISQLVSPGAIDALDQLPSFSYRPHSAELNPGDCALPWQEQNTTLVGTIARTLGSKTPIRLVASAKSWLCHGGIDRRAKTLPFGSDDEVAKISPLEASAQYLDHLRAAWDSQFPLSPLKDQDVTVTIPASFDPVARELTAEAAKQIGCEHLTLLEEPMSAVYNWVNACGDDWRSQVSVGDIILVVDIGGGTTDLSLVAVGEEEGKLSLTRIAVGEHILLGGDNMDLALAYRVKAKLTEQGKTLEPWQIQAIGQACRDAKEALLGDSDIQVVPITVPSRGSKLFGGTLRCELTRDEVTQVLTEGFFPLVDISESPRQSPRSALTQRGLPYAQDPAVSRHLAAFLTRQKNALDSVPAHEEDPFAIFAEPLGSPVTTPPPSTEFIQPSAILLNGGVLKAPRIKARVVQLINQWLMQAGAPEARVLEGADLDLGVAKGASYYGQVRQGKGVRIRGGLANAYYVGIESAMPAIPGMEPPLEALCIAPFGMEEGSIVEAGEQTFGLVIGEPVHFRFFGSSTRHHDGAGALLSSWAEGELNELPSLTIELPLAGGRAGDILPVRLSSYFTEIGTLELEAVGLRADGTIDSAQRWHVELDVRD